MSGGRHRGRSAGFGRGPGAPRNAPFQGRLHGRLPKGPLLHGDLLHGPLLELVPSWFVLAGSLVVVGACDSKKQGMESPPPSATGRQVAEPASVPVLSPAPKKNTTTGPGGDTKMDSEDVPAECPSGMKRVPGGVFWVGTRSETYDREENPQFSTHVTSFCADTFEVSTQEYEDCAQHGKCPPLRGKNKTCNTTEKGKGEHPVNCIDFAQAQAVCAAREARLPTEVEWEYMARGGAEMRPYPWGSDEPDGNTCWKHAGTCPRGQFTEGAFGLHDVVGNVWEWTSSWFGRYPWPEQEGRHRVYRGGSWSRRFAKWMRPGLRNRLDPQKSGSHLGVRCVASLPDEPCAYGKSQGGQCLFGVEEVHCLDGDEFNGVRCARPGDERRCLPGAEEEPGFGCVRPRVKGKIDHELDTEGVTRARSPEYDADCRKNTPGRPMAYRFEGGGHLARNVVGQRYGCKNRDVGVGFNSSCCP